MTITHRYTGHGDYFPGLPAIDVDALTLTPEQLGLLADGIKQGMYAPISLTDPAPVEEVAPLPEQSSEPVTEPTPDETQTEPEPAPAE